MGMQNYTPGTPAAVVFSLLNEAGEVLVPTSLRYRVLDEAETELWPWTAITVTGPPQTSVSVTVLGVTNILTAPALRGIRTVDLEVTTALGTVMLSKSLLLCGETGMAFGVNTMQTYSQALLLAEDFSDQSISAWAAADDRDAREKALIQAFGRILQLPISLQFDDTQSIMNVDTAFTMQYGPIMLNRLSPAQMAALYKPMLDGLRKAQLVEADEILSGDPVMTARINGLTSLTVGESSQFFRAAKPIEYAVCPRAIQHVQRWVRFGMRIQRR